jgi:hypothetical protein
MFKNGVMLFLYNCPAHIKYVDFFLLNEFCKKMIKNNIIVKNIFIKSDLEVDSMQAWVTSSASLNTKILTSLVYDPSSL